MMLRYKFAALRVVIDLVIYYLLVKSYVFGIALGIKLFGFDYWFIEVVYGAIMAAGVNYLIGLFKRYVLFMFKCGTIWSVCFPEDQAISTVLTKVTCDWKETFTIPAINLAVRKVFDGVGDLILSKDKETPEILQVVADSTLFKTSKKLAMKTFDYADECVLAWSYSHEDSLLTECIDGICSFVVNLPKLVLYITPVVILQTITRVVVAVAAMLAGIHLLGIELTTIVPIYLIVLGADYTLCDAILEPFTMDSVIRKFMSYGESSEEMMNFVQELLNADERMKDLKALVNKFGGNHETGGDDKEAVPYNAEERVEDSPE